MCGGAPSPELAAACDATLLLALHGSPVRTNAAGADVDAGRAGSSSCSGGSQPLPLPGVLDA
eukprot:285344-Chlamydomonas_euryale.AAC.1